MSMLAERKRKQKWSLNPRGKTWSQDANKFGQKLLEKMGWSQGKGLGANEDGRTEHVKVVYKNDSQGMGYKQTDDQWTEHESNFTALLKSLGGGEAQDNSEIKLNSLEKKSEKSKARVHYRKFTRGKDLSQYSEKDLANIFGKKSLKEIKKSKENANALEGVVSEDIEEDRNFSNAGLMSDYFKKKIPNFGNTNSYVVGNNGVLKRGYSSESEGEQRPSFGLGFSSEEKISQSYIEREEMPHFGLRYKQEKIATEPTVSDITDKNKQIKQASTFISYISESNIEDLNDVESLSIGLKEDKNSSKNIKGKKKRVSEGDNENTPAKKKKLETSSEKKKKDKTKNKLKDDTGLLNPGFDPLYTPHDVEKHILDPIEESQDESVDDTFNDTVGQVVDSFQVHVQIHNENTPEKLKNDSNDFVLKKEKKKDKMNRRPTENIDQLFNEDLKTSRKSKNTVKMDTSGESFYGSKKEKKKKRKLSSSDVSEEDFEVNFHTKKSKSKKFNRGIENPLFNVSIEDETIAEIPKNSYEVQVLEKKKKKGNKNKENVGLENPIFNGEDNIDPRDVVNEEYEIKRKDKSKKKKKHKEEKGIDNPVLNLNDTIEENCDLMLNVVATPVQVTENRNDLENNVSIQKVKGVARRKSVRFSDVTRERIIPNKEEIENETLDDSRDIVELQGKLNDSSDLTYIDKFLPKKKDKKRRKGVDNTAFDQQANIIEENITTISKTLDTYQAEIENDINEAKIKTVEIEDIMVGEVGNPNGTNEKLSDGTVKLKFKYANFKRSASYLESLTGAKKSYKHLIKGDIVMNFKETNLHEIEGYATASVS